MARSSSSWAALEVWPSVAPALRHTTWTARARTWASGRNISVRAPSCRRSSGRNSTMLVATRAKLPCVISQPLGLPVVPEVYTSEATSARPAVLRCRSSSASVTPVPAAARLARLGAAPSSSIRTTVSTALPSSSESARTPGHQVLLGPVLDEHPAGAGVVQDPLDLACRGGLINRNGHAAGKPDGEVHQGPLVPGSGHDGHGVARAPGRRRSGPWPAP